MLPVLNPKLSVAVVGIAFGQGDAARVTLSAAVRLDAGALCCLILSPGETLELSDWWESISDQALLVLRLTGASAHELALSVVEVQAPGPLAVLLHLPASPWSIRGLLKRDNHPLASQLTGMRRDLQVHLYAPSWSLRPPRVI